MDGELIKQYLWRLHQLRHFVLPLLVPSRQTAALPAPELTYSRASRGRCNLAPVTWGFSFGTVVSDVNEVLVGKIVIPSSLSLKGIWRTCDNQILEHYDVED